MTTLRAGPVSLGHPSYVWRAGQERRLALVRRYVPLEQKAILDIGCGVGMYLNEFRRLSDTVWGIEVERDRAARAQSYGNNVVLAVGESLPFPDATFDVVFLHEVIEHVTNDRETLAEAARVLRPGGSVVIYAPNRLYLFETHGFYLGKRYIFRLLPFVNYLPDILRNRFVPHARVYRDRDIRALLKGLPLRVNVHRHVYPGFDNVVARHRRLGSWLRRVLYRLEETPLQVFGLSHFVVATKVLTRE